MHPNERINNTLKARELSIPDDTYTTEETINQLKALTEKLCLVKDRITIDHSVIEIETAIAEAVNLRAEVERLRAGGCARDQNTTQYCSEAVTLEAKLKDMHNRFVRLENDYDSLRVWCEGVEADNTTYRNEHLKALDQRNEARREILRLLENNHPTMFDAQAEKQRRNWIGL